MNHHRAKRVFFFVVGIVLLVAAAAQRTNRVVAQEIAKPLEHSRSLDRPPARMISDPNPVFSGIAIDSERGEVFMANNKESAEPSVVVFPTQFQQVDGVREHPTYKGVLIWLITATPLSE